MSKRYVSQGDGTYVAQSTGEVSANLRNQGFSPTLSRQLADEHATIATTSAKRGMKPQKQAMGPVSMVWELPDSGSKI